MVFSIFFFGLSVLYGQSAADAVSQLDGAVKSLAAEINTKIPAGGSPKIILNQWTYQNSVPAFGVYWAAQLTGELSNIPGRSFILISGGSAAADWTVSGEVVEISGIIRVYTRLIRSGDYSIAASFHTDFDFNEYFAEMLSGGGGSSSVVRDACEIDSYENPLAVEIGSDNSGNRINRTLHTENDEDFFLLIPDGEGTLIMETTGTMDTYMELYDADSEDKLDSNDDGGSGGNASIRRDALPGDRYIAKVRGYDHETGSYGFHAWLAEPFRMTPDEYEDDHEVDSAKEIALGIPQEHTFTTGEDVDWVTFRISRPGSYTIRTRGLYSAGLDTYIELYDGDQNSIDDDDDGGEAYDSRLSVRLQTGTYYLRVECLDSEPDEPYTIRVDGED
jgi:hypothetical protein